MFSQRPDRWRAVVAEVPFVDVVTTMFDASIPLTVNEWDEWGDPRRRRRLRLDAGLLAVRQRPRRPARRPDLLVTGAVHDPRVMVREPAKWVARLRETDPEWSPRCLFRVETGAGAHAGPSGRFGHLAYEAEVYAWVLDRLGVAARDADLHAEVLEVARALIRFDTSNAPEAALGRPPGNETGPATYLRDYLSGAGVDCELIARDPRRANLVARIPGTGEAPSLAFVGHTDVVPADPRDWTHPPFEAVVDEGGWLWGRGAIDMKNEVAARAVAMAELARSGFRPRGDLWLIAVADEEDGMADVGMRWLLEARPDIRPDLALNEGGGSTARRCRTAGSCRRSASARRAPIPARVVALGEAGHASTPSVGDNAVPILGELLRRVGARDADVARRRTWSTGPWRCCSGSRSPTPSRRSHGPRPCIRSSPTPSRRWPAPAWRRRCSPPRPSAT